MRKNSRDTGKSKSALTILVFLLVLGFGDNVKYKDGFGLENANAETPPGSIPSFPGAEGFGAMTTGGRGGKVVYVTNLNASGPGSLNDAFGFRNNVNMQEPRYILFKTSGVISPGWSWDGKTHIEHGEFTLAGHTSPGGIITPGMLAMCKAETCNLDNIIIRHLRSRPAGQSNSNDDAFRLNASYNDRAIGANYVILDHVSFGNADDEAMQISYNRNYTIQNSIIAETLGEHYNRGGTLIKYGSDEFPLDNISFHHNIFNRIGGRIPQVDCGDSDDHSFCDSGRTINYEISNNIFWDPVVAVLHKTEAISGKDYNLTFKENFINNYGFYRDSYCDTLFGWYGDSSLQEVFASGNQMNLYPSKSDWELFGNNNNFCNNNVPSSFSGAKPDVRHSHATITYTPVAEILTYMALNAGAFPRDPMDHRLMDWVEREEIDPTPQWEIGKNYGESDGANDSLDFNWTQTPPPPYLDSDDDGMPDWWEIHNGLNPTIQDHNGKNLSTVYTGVSNYDNLEVYINRYSDYLIAGKRLTEEQPYNYSIQIIEGHITPRVVTAGQENQIQIQFSVNQLEEIQKAEIALDNLSEPYAWPSPASIDVTNLNSDNSWEYTYNIPSDRDPGEYEVMIHVENVSGENGFISLPITIESPSGQPLNIATIGNGQVTTVPAGAIVQANSNNCYNYIQNDIITLIATPEEGKKFIKWTGDACNEKANPICQITMSQAANITANFEQNSNVTPSIFLLLLNQ